MRTASDVFRIAMLGWCLAASMLSPVTVMAVEFALVGPRAIGMGGVGVAVTTDALATYWNPAGLAMKQSVDFRIQGSVPLTDAVIGLGANSPPVATSEMFTPKA